MRLQLQKFLTRPVLGKEGITHGQELSEALGRLQTAAAAKIGFDKGTLFDNIPRYPLTKDLGDIITNDLLQAARKVHRMVYQSETTPGLMSFTYGHEPDEKALFDPNDKVGCGVVLQSAQKEKAEPLQIIPIAQFRKVPLLIVLDNGKLETSEIERFNLAKFEYATRDGRRLTPPQELEEIYSLDCRELKPDRTATAANKLVVILPNTKNRIKNLNTRLRPRC